MVSDSLRQGLFFGFNSGIITSLGVLAGLSGVVNSPKIIIVALISLAISDGLSEAYSLYFSIKSKRETNDDIKAIKALKGVVLSKVAVTLSFLLPLLFVKDLKMYKNMSFPIIWGAILLLFIDFNLIKDKDEQIQKYLIPQVFIIVFLIIFGKIFEN
jgi:VIT1/CCC1 family predicted Fe2+/Mn2+ transporter